MKAKRLRKQPKGQRVRAVTISVDIVTDTIVQALMAREGGSFSAAICALATSAALKDADLMASVKVVVEQTVKERLEASGFHPGFSETLTREMVTGRKDPNSDYNQHHGDVTTDDDKRRLPDYSGRLKWE